MKIFYKFFIYFCLNLITFQTYSQQTNWTWAERMGGIGYDHFCSLTIDNKNNIIVLGDLENQGTIGIDTTQIHKGFLIAKYNKSNNLLWVKQTDMLNTNHIVRGLDITSDCFNNIYITGIFGGTIVFGNDTLIYRSSPLFGRDFFISKCDSNGNFLWARQFEGGYSLDPFSTTPYNIVNDKQMNTYITGYFLKHLIVGNDTLYTSYKTDMFLIKYDSLGNLKWLVQEGNINDDCKAYGVTTDTLDNVYVTGVFIDTAYFGTDTLTCPYTGVGAFIAKYDNLGSLLWTRKNCGGVGQSITTDNMNNIYITGEQPININSIFIAKYNSNGDFIWQKSAKSSSTFSSNYIAADNNNNIYITGEYSGDAIFENDTLFGHQLHKWVFVAKYDSAGNFKWFTKGKSDFASLHCYEIACNKSNEVFLTGNFYQSVTFDSLSLVSAGNTDGFIAKIKENQNGILTIDNSSKIYLFPNPANDFITINCKLNNKTAQYSIVDITGKVVMSGKLKLGSSHTIGIKQLTNGLYIINITDGEYVFNVKFIKQD